VGAAVALAAAARVPALVAVMLAAMTQEHERGLGGWQAEWETLPEICLLAAGALARITEMMEGLEVDAARMRRNVEATNGLIFAEAVAMALGRRMGRPAAHALVEQASRRALEQGRHLREVLAEDERAREHLSPDELEGLFDPASYLGVADQLVSRALAGRGAARDHGG
jgi:3-carboxy-cis,cis-muconate cycloisomerase